MAANGFIQLLRLAEQGRQRQQRQAAVSASARWSGVAFRVGAVRLVAPLGEVAEVISLPELAVLPGAQPWMRGLANVRGRLMPVTELGNYAAQPVGTAGGGGQLRRKILVIDQPALFAGVLVDEVFAIQHFEQNTYSVLRSEELAELGGLAPYLTGRFERDGENWYIFLLSRLAQDSRFLDASA